MKVRHKQDGYIYNVIEESATYYICKDTAQALRKNEVEVIADESRWQDVTGECEGWSGAEYCITHDGKQIGPRKHEYRLRKVQVPNHGSGMSSYFIVERKVSE